MRIVATSDTHNPIRIGMQQEIPNGDVFIHAGDLMQNGYPDEWKSRLNWLKKLPHKKKYYIPGNHDLHLKNYTGPALQNLRSAGVTVVGLPNNPRYEIVTLDNGMTLLGLPFVTNLPNWAFSISEEELKTKLQRKVDIVVSHAPIRGILDTNNNGENMGIKSYREYLYKFFPKIWIHGHIHEAFGHTEEAGCQIYNVAMCDRKQEQVNVPVVIDI